MALKDQLQKHTDAIFNLNHFAETATYTSKLDIANPFPVTILKRIKKIPGKEAGSTSDIAEIQVKASEVPDPRYADVITMNSDNWTVQEVLAKGPTMWLLFCRKRIRSTYK